MHTKWKEIIFKGDLNIDMLLENEPLTSFWDQFCLANTITDPTRVTVSSKTLLDFILISHPDHSAASDALC